LGSRKRNCEKRRGRCQPFVCSPKETKEEQPLGDGRACTAYLEADNNGVKIQDRLPVLAKDVQADLALQVDVGVVNLLLAQHLWRLVREVLVDLEVEIEAAAAVHALVRVDG
jgi:hypothetical protein